MKKQRSQVGIRFFQGFVLLGGLNGLVGTFLILFIHVETVGGTGPIEAGLGLIILIFAMVYRHLAGIFLGASMIGISVLMFLLVLLLEWSPREAYLPFSFLASIYMLFSLPLTIYVTVRPPILYQEWQCHGCGYLIYGLQSPQCPECGNVLNPDLVAKYQYQDSAQA
jgi:hypothetical protein